MSRRKASSNAALEPATPVDLGPSEAVSAGGVVSLEGDYTNDTLGQISELLGGRPPADRRAERRQAEPPPTLSRPVSVDNQAEDPPTLSRPTPLDDRADAVLSDDQAAPVTADVKSAGTLAAIAEQVGVDPAELYKTQVPLRDGETISIGELKDAWQSRVDHDLDRVTWEEAKSAQQSEIAQSRRELSELLALVPREVLKPEMLDHARKIHEARMTSERTKLLAAIPEWSDTSRRDADLATMATHLESFGMPPTMLNEVSDHRMFALIRESALRKQRLDAALAQLETTRVKPAPSPSRRAPDTGLPRSPGGGQKNQQTNAQLRAISDLLGKR